MNEENKSVVKKTIQNIKLWFARQKQSIREILPQLVPSERIWIGAGFTIIGLALLFYLVFVVETFLPAGLVYFLVALIIPPVITFLGIELVIIIIKAIMIFPTRFLVGAVTGLVFFMMSFNLFNSIGIMLGFLTVLLGGIFGFGLAGLLTTSWETLKGFQKNFFIGTLTVGIISIAIIMTLLVHPGFSVETPPRAVETANLQSLAITQPDPSETGSHNVSFLTYGSGTDRRRPEFSKNTTIISDSVDGSPFVTGWTGLRTRVWGFDSTALPLNGRVWYPDGPGRFPLILIVHGNHLAEDYSDPGYEYLCELLASHGSICVSVDQNFINSSPVGNMLGFNQLENENDLRGWLLLEHIAFWEGLNNDTETRFQDRVDLENIALIGHSRGGEAVAIASAFNRLSHYPDDANVLFDFNYSIQSVVAIAPVDRQYQPANQQIPLENINYLTIQGAHDMDVNSFDGYNAFERVVLPDEPFHFKSTLYIYGANHGQFNTRWGDLDMSRPRMWLYNRGQLIDQNDQMQIARVYINAFIEATLKGNSGYLPLFQNYQVGLDWLPDTIYINAYSDSHSTYLATYEEDIDITTGSVQGVRLEGLGLLRWREDRVPTKWGRMHSNSAVFLSWQTDEASASYSVILEEDFNNIEEQDQLVFTAAQSGQNLDDEGKPTPIDFTIALIDQNGQAVELPLRTIGRLQPEIVANLRKAEFLETAATSEVVFQTYQFNISDFVRQTPEFDLTGIREIRFIFDQTEQGQIWLDNIGFRTLP